ncbi:helix-turn-helix domain-containing protein, partial [Virgibacillus salexigens]|uniref:helix-turn-helix domain-containing protein n=1 Tax=Virgibacillus salexigens TaxID=61016 RepID=UPI003082038C
MFETLASSDAPMDATQIVKYSGDPKAKVYEVLTRMIDKGMVMDSISEKKKRYPALPLRLAIENLTAEFQENIKQLKTKTNKKPFLDDRIWSLKVN